MLTGNTGVNLLSGGAGNDTLDGGADAVVDTLTGGTGDDTYWIQYEGADTVVENSGEGTDTIRAKMSYTLGANLENLQLESSGNLSGVGNSLANRITAWEGNNLLDEAETYSINGNPLLSQGYNRYGRSITLGVSFRF